jgi:hypothetical protein
MFGWFGAVSEQLERDPSPILPIGAFSQVDHPHSAPPKLAQHAIGTDMPVSAGLAQEGGRRLHRVSFQDTVTAIMGPKQRLDLGAELRVGAVCLQPSGALIPGLIERAIEELIDGAPPLGVSGRGVMPSRN